MPCGRTAMTCGSPSPSSWSPMRSRWTSRTWLASGLGMSLSVGRFADPRGCLRHSLSAAFSASFLALSDSSVRGSAAFSRHPAKGSADRLVSPWRWTTTWTGRFGSRAGWIHTIARAPVLSAASSVVLAVFGDCRLVPGLAARPGPPAASCGWRRWCAAHPCSSRPHRATRPPAARRDRRASRRPGCRPGAGARATGAARATARTRCAATVSELRSGDRQPAGDRPCSDGTPHPPARTALADARSVLSNRPDRADRRRTGPYDAEP